MSNHKVKGLLKGLRYISHIFENEKEAEMKIGFPTDVKHVAHIGWDGQSVNSPSWMSEFKSPANMSSSAPLILSRDGKEDDGSVNGVSEDSSRRGLEVQNSPAREFPELPRSSRRQSSSGSAAESPRRDKPRPRRSSKSSKDSSEVPKSGLSTNGGDPSTTQNPPEVAKKTRRKKSKDSSTGGSAKSRPKSQATSETYQSPFSDAGSESVSSVSEPKTSDRNQKQLEEGEEKGFS